MMISLTVLPIAALNAADKLSEICGRCQFPNFSFGDQSARDTARLRLFTVVTKHLFQFGFSVSIDNRLGIQFLAPVHAHVEPGIGTEAKPTFGRIYLMGGNSQIQDHSFNRTPTDIS